MRKARVTLSGRAIWLPSLDATRVAIVVETLFGRALFASRYLSTFYFKPSSPHLCASSSLVAGERDAAVTAIQKGCKGRLRRRGLHSPDAGEDGEDGEGSAGRANSLGTLGKLQHWALRKGLPPKLQDVFDEMSGDEQEYLARQPSGSYERFLQRYQKQQAVFSKLAALEAEELGLELRPWALNLAWPWNWRSLNSPSDLRWP